MRPPPRTALVTGANRGLGLATAQRLAEEGLRVVLTAREEGAARAAASALRRDGLEVRAERLDVASPDSIASCAARLADEGLRVDVLVNNAALYPPGGVLGTAPGTWLTTMETNFLGPWRLCRAFVPAMLREGYGRVVNVSSGSGSFGEGLEGPAAYCVSKAALDALTLKLAQEVRGDVKVNACCPGWVRTEMGGAGADRSIDEGVDTIVWLATLPRDGPNGGFFRERQPIPW